jgi:hypothetical protein
MLLRSGYIKTVVLCWEVIMVVYVLTCEEKMDYTKEIVGTYSSVELAIKKKEKLIQNLPYAYGVTCNWNIEKTTVDE